MFWRRRRQKSNTLVSLSQLHRGETETVLCAQVRSRTRLIRSNLIQEIDQSEVISEHKYFLPQSWIVSGLGWESRIHTPRVINTSYRNLVYNQSKTSKFRELWSPALGLLLVRVKVTRSKLVLMERGCHKEYTCEIWKQYLLRFRSYDQG